MEWHPRIDPPAVDELRERRTIHTHCKAGMGDPSVRGQPQLNRPRLPSQHVEQAVGHMLSRVYPPRSNWPIALPNRRILRLALRFVRHQVRFGASLRRSLPTATR